MAEEKSQTMTVIEKENKFQGRNVPWTVADVIEKEKYPKTYLTYHVMGAGWDVFTPIGTVLGGTLGYTKIIKASSPLIAAGTGGLLAGSAGMMFGLVGMYKASNLGENAKPQPWNEKGIQKRVDGISKNCIVRMLDLGSWLGILSGGALYATFGPTYFGLSKGVLGVLQAASIGSSVGAAASGICLYKIKK